MYFFAVETPNYEIGQQYWYHWNLQVFTNVTGKSRLYTLCGSRDTIVLDSCTSEI